MKITKNHKYHKILIQKLFLSKMGNGKKIKPCMTPRKITLSQAACTEHSAHCLLPWSPETQDLCLSSHWQPFLLTSAKLRMFSSGLGEQKCDFPLFYGPASWLTRDSGRSDGFLHGNTVLQLDLLCHCEESYLTSLFMSKYQNKHLQ